MHPDARLRVFYVQAEDGIRYLTVTGVQTCALPISLGYDRVQTGLETSAARLTPHRTPHRAFGYASAAYSEMTSGTPLRGLARAPLAPFEIGRASCRERV